MDRLRFITLVLLFFTGFLFLFLNDLEIEQKSKNPVIDLIKPVYRISRLNYFVDDDGEEHLSSLQGTAIGISPNKLLTAYHVVAKVEDVELEVVEVFSQKTGLKLGECEYKIVKTDSETDLALIEIEETLPHYITIENIPSSNFEIGSKLFAIGASQGQNPFVTVQGYLFQKSPIYWVCSGYIQRGSSGGPIFNEKGQLLGIVSKISSFNPSSVTFFISLPTIIEFLSDQPTIKIK